MTKIPFLSQNSLIPTKIHTEINNRTQAHINTYKSNQNNSSEKWVVTFFLFSRN